MKKPCQSAVPLLHYRNGQPRRDHHVVYIKPASNGSNGQMRLNCQNNIHEESEQDLLEAVHKNNIKQVRKLIKNGTDVNIKDQKTGRTAAHFACKFGYTNILEVLLNNGVSINELDINEETPLHIAVRKSNESSCQLLLSYQCIDTSLANKFGKTPLHIVAEKGNKNICNLILKQSNSALINEKNKITSETALHIAAKKNNFEVLKLLLEFKANWKLQDSNTYMPLHSAAHEGSTDCCRILLEVDTVKHGTQTLRNGKTALMLAAEGGYSECCEVLLIDNSYINNKDKNKNTALHYAMDKFSFETVNVLLRRGADPNAVNDMKRTPVMIAARKRNTKCLETLNNHGGRLDEFDKARKGCLHFAAEENNEDCMKYLLDHLKNISEIIDCKMNNGYTALNLAIKRKGTACALQLIKKGASLTETDMEGMTPLHLAAEKGMTDVCKKLLENQNVAVNKSNKKSEIPLHLASKREIIRILLQKGARLTATDINGQTVLHKACRSGNKEVVKYLIGKKIKVTIRDDTGANALHLAAECKSEHGMDCCKALIDHSPQLNYEKDNNGLLPIDRAFENNNDTIFEYLIMNLQYKENEMNLEERLHIYMKTALDPPKRRKTIIQGIAKSAWWTAGFYNKENDHFLKLIEYKYDDLVSIIQEKCIKSTNTKSESRVTYDFRLYQYKKTGGNGVYDQMKSHPLALMANLKMTQSLQHKMTTFWVLSKFKFHAARFIMLILVELLFVGLLVAYMANVMNWDIIEKRCNITRNMLMQARENGSASDLEAALQKCTGYTSYPSYICLIINTVILFLIECNYIYRLATDYISSSSDLLQVARFICTLVAICPDTYTWPTLVLHTWCWMFGIAAVLLASLHLITTIHGLPVSVVMSQTHSFLKSFVFNIFHLFVLALVFAFTFHLMLCDQKAFSSIYQSLIKMFVWMLGDLSYDDTFIDEELMYPVGSNILFIVFLMVMGGYIANLIVTQYSNKAEDFFDEAAFNLAASRVKFLLKSDRSFFWIRKRKFPDIFTEEQDEKFTWFIKKILMLDTQLNVIKENTNGEENISTSQNNRILELQEIQSEDIKNMKEKITSVINRLDELQNILSKLQPEDNRD